MNSTEPAIVFLQNVCHGVAAWGPHWLFHRFIRKHLNFRQTDGMALTTKITVLFVILIMFRALLRYPRGDQDALIPQKPLWCPQTPSDEGGKPNLPKVSPDCPDTLLTPVLRCIVQVSKMLAARFNLRSALGDSTASTGVQKPSYRHGPVQF